MAGNNRRFNREPHDSVLEVFDGDGKTISWTAKLVNFSLGGASFLTTRNLARGCYISGRIRIMGKGVMEISARVVWAKKKINANLYGIRFDSVKKVR